MDNLAKDMDGIMDKLNMKYKSPKLNPVQDRDYWLDKPGAPKAFMAADEKPVAIPYEEALKQWLD
jgi:glycerol transport system substrate-binding protein